MLKLLIISILLTLVACEASQQKFDSKQWIYIDGNYNHRDLMIQDLMKSILYKGMKFKEVEKILGKPNELTFNKKVTYEIYYNFYDEEHRELNIYFSKDSTISKYTRVVWKSK